LLGALEYHDGDRLRAAGSLFNLELHQVPFVRRRGFLNQASTVKEDLLAGAKSDKPISFLRAIPLDDTTLVSRGWDQTLTGRTEGRRLLKETAGLRQPTLLGDSPDPAGATLLTGQQLITECAIR
jgi:hypothetical protein